MKITIKGIEIQAVVGTLDYERTNSQKIIIDIEFEYDAEAAAISDDIKFAVDYSKIVELTIKAAKESKCRLLETLAERIILLLKSFTEITSAKVTAKKPSSIKNVEFVSAAANF